MTTAKSVWLGLCTLMAVVLMAMESISVTFLTAFKVNLKKTTKVIEPFNMTDEPKKLGFPNGFVLLTASLLTVANTVLTAVRKIVKAKKTGGNNANNCRWRSPALTTASLLLTQRAG